MEKLRINRKLNRVFLQKSVFHVLHDMRINRDKVRGKSN